MIKIAKKILFLPIVLIAFHSLYSQNKNIKPQSVILLLGILLISCNQNNIKKNESVSKFVELRDHYLGQKPPGMIPELFAPGLLSAGGDEANITFTPENML